MTDFRFIDLFAGIGGFRLGFEAAGGECVFTSEIDPHARKTYAVNHGVEEASIAGDIAEVEPADIPDHDVLLAGFPCQAFSMAGRRKGFEDTRGTLFFEIARILAAGRTPAFCLENVKGLLNHENGNTFEVITRTLRELGYHLSFQVINAAAWVPQNRKRLFLCGHRENRAFNIDFMPVPDPRAGPKLGSILEREPPLDHTLTDGTWEWLQKHTQKHNPGKDGKFGYGYNIADLDGAARTMTSRYGKDGREILIDQDEEDAFKEVRLTDRVWKLYNRRRKESRPPNVFGPEDVGNTLISTYGGTGGGSRLLIDDHFEEVRLTDKGLAAIEKHAAERGYKVHVLGKDDVGNTLVSMYQGSTGASALLVKGEKRNPRRLTARECARLMGFPDTFEIPVPRTHAYRLFGNSIVPQVPAHIATYLKEEIK